jgi:hypothetical protein
VITRMFEREQLEELGLPYEAIAQVELEEHRWYRWVRCVFSFEDEFWAVDWARPLTEMQEDLDDWLDQDPVPAYRVESQEVTTEVWEPVE